MRKYLLLLCCYLFIHVLSYAQPMKLDNTFGKNGYCLDSNGAEIYTFDFDTSGSIVAVGYSLPDTGSHHTVLSKYSKDGIADSSFGFYGAVKTKFGDGSMPYGMAIQPDNKILVTGDFTKPLPTGGYYWYVARYNNNGTPDSSFGQYGLASTSVTPTHLFGVACLQNNKILAAGQNMDTCILVRLNADGSPDTTFGVNGTRNLADTNLRLSLWQFVPLSDGNFLAVGNDHIDKNNNKVAAVKVDSNGNRVSSFGQDGKLIMDLFNPPPAPFSGETFAHAVELPSGKILLNGWDSTMIFLRINSDGTPDSSFGVNGLARTHFPCRDFTIQPDGKILMAGNVTMSPYNDGYSFARLDSLGNADPSFNITGQFNTDISTGNDYVQCVKMQDGKILAGGGSGPYQHYAFAMVRLDLDTGLSVENIIRQHNEALIYPNPSDGNITIKGRSANAGIEVYNMNGQKVYVTAITSQNEHLSLSLPDGIYLLKYTAAENTVLQRLVIYH